MASDETMVLHAYMMMQHDAKGVFITTSRSKARHYADSLARLSLMRGKTIEIQSDGGLTVSSKCMPGSVRFLYAIENPERYRGWSPEFVICDKEALEDPGIPHHDRVEWSHLVAHWRNKSTLRPVEIQDVREGGE